MTPFDDIYSSVTSEDVRQSLSDVGDAMLIGQKWFEQYSDITPTASDLFTFAEMVFRREAYLNAEKSE